MPYKTRLIDAMNSGPLKTVAGVCSNSDTFKDLVNEVQERLWRRGNWWNSEWPVKVCIHNHCITWPRWVGTVLAMRSCDGAWDMQNRWYGMIPRESCASWEMPFDWMSSSRRQTVAFDGGTCPIYNDITGTTGKLARYYVRNHADIGKKIKIHGLGYGNQPLQEFINGAWEDGITITAAAPFGTNSQLITKIIATPREATSGMGYLYSYDQTTQELVDLAQYEPSETNPQYRRSRVDGYCDNYGRKQLVNGQSDAERRIVQIEALVKLQFIPAVSVNDFLFIDVIPAIKLGIQAVKLEEANQDDSARRKWLLAIDELNMEDRDKVPSQQTVVVESVMGGRAILSPT